MRGAFLFIKSGYDIISRRPTAVVNVTLDDRVIAKEFLQESVFVHFAFKAL
jgi:hypothetical protein